MTEIKKQCVKGSVLLIDSDSATVRIKRTAEAGIENVETENEEECAQTSEIQCDDTLHQVNTFLEKLGQRGQDFLSLINAVSDGRLPVDNIALHLLLDIGQFFRQKTVHSMRYSTVSLHYWLLVDKLFGDRAVRFFRGYKGIGKDNDGMLSILIATFFSVMFTFDVQKYLCAIPAHDPQS